MALDGSRADGEDPEACSAASVLEVFELTDLMTPILHLAASTEALLVTTRVAQDAPAVALSVRRLIWQDRILKGTAILKGHAHAINSGAFSPDGQHVVTVGKDGAARLWDAETGALQSKLGAHTGFVWSCAFSSDGKRVVTASLDGTARLWDAETGALLVTLEGNIGFITSCAFSLDGTRVVTGSLDGTARLWDAETGVLQTTLEGHIKSVYSCVFSSNGEHVVTASYDKTARLWDAETGAPQATFEGHTGLIWSCAFTSDSKRVVTASAANTARLWDAETGALQTALVGHTDFVTSCASSPDGKRVATTSMDWTARLWDAETGTLQTTLQGHTGIVKCCAFSSDGERIVTASYDKTARLWDAETGALQTTLEGHTGMVLSCAFSSDGERVVTASSDGTARLWDGVVVEAVLLQLALHGEFASAAAAAAELGHCSLVCRAWRQATGSEAVWRAPYLRASPTLVRAPRNEALPAPALAPRPDRDTGSEDEFDDEDYGAETAAPLLHRSRFFRDAVLSPFVEPQWRGAASESFYALYKRHLAAAMHGAAHYRESGIVLLDFSNMPQFTCTTARDAPPSTGGAPAPALRLADVSFIFEVFELDCERRSREQATRDLAAEEKRYCGRAPRDAAEDSVAAPDEDFVSARLRHRFAGPPHFAARRDMGTHTENLVWATTVRANEYGLVQALVPRNDGGRLERAFALPIDSGMDDDSSQWCIQWRVVVTAVRDADGAMCQLVDVRGMKIADGANGESHRVWLTFRVAEAWPGVPRDRPLDVKVHFGMNSGCGPLCQGDAHRHDFHGDAACLARCGRGRADVERAIVRVPGGYNDPGHEAYRGCAEAAIDPSDAAAENARDAFAAFRRNDAVGAGGALFQISLNWLDATRLEEDGSASSHNDWVAAKLAQLEWH
ncbi:WD40-repeat-containing domain protein [Pelagophyceae sp. CCMP2097]|nr:WD40-repeat-containing domain protein [Pelagophyceae sp. CCMP2097]